MNTYLQLFIKDRPSVIIFMCAMILVPSLMAMTFSSTPIFLKTTTVGQAKSVIITDPINVTQAIELKGSLVARSRENVIKELTFSIRNAPGVTPLNLADHSLIINYRDEYQRINNINWKPKFQGHDDRDNLLDDGELLQLTIPLAEALQIQLGPNTAFVLDIIPPHGAPLTLHHKTPDELNPLIDLDQS